ncbi:hypothetical protein SKAU_G00011860 [Synaphobranchus kaupii]|uniref:DNA transposase THAP9 n=1 Tax=Synaphobranchus kaupii TaxID=118154 RepID=A0A9Q1GB56_SYNKA|nr:hypothetical protein SKAU_G00011860 [Synaphobranchus kaupii]
MMEDLAEQISVLNSNDDDIAVTADVHVDVGGEVSGVSRSECIESPRTLKRKAEGVQQKLLRCRKKLRIQTQKTRRLKRKVFSLKDITGELQKKLLISTECADLLESINEVPREILTRIQQKRSAKFSEELRQFAITLHFYSPKAYEYVREKFNFALPHTQTIRNWYSSVSADPGFTVASFNALKNHVAEKKKEGKETVCALMIDEIYIHQQVDFGSGQIHGYVDFGTGEIDNTVATQAMVLMVVSINESWKIPFAYFLIASITGKEKVNIIRESLCRLHAIGVRVVSLTCDGPSQNFAMVRELGADLNILNMRPYFPHPEDPTLKVHVLLDPCHMLKLLRNAFATAGVLETEDGKQIKWQYIEHLNTLQEKEGLRLGNKLRMAHIQWRKQKMKVHLAAQLFSSSVADALEYCEQELKYPQFRGCAATVQFLRTIDGAFDVLNSRNPLGKGLKAPIKPSTKDRAEAILQRAETCLRGLKVNNGKQLVHMHSTAKKTSIYGFIANGRSALNIYNDLVERPNAPCRYLLTYKLSQDHLELFFAAVRARGGYNNNPNARQFRAAYKRLLVRHQVKTGTGNCLLRDNTDILDSTPAAVNIARRMDVELVEMLLPGDDTIPDLPDVDHLSEYKDAAINYIAGFVVKKLREKVTCMPCSQALTSMEGTHSFLALKDRGGLQKPSKDMVAVCQATERCFQRLLRRNGGKPPQGSGVTLAVVTQVLADCAEKNLFPGLHNHMFDTCVEANHVHILVKMASSWFCKVRLNHLARRATEKFKCKMVRRRLTKLIHFYGE